MKLEGIKIPLSFMKGQKDLWAWIIKYGALLLVFLFFYVPIQSRLSSSTDENNALRKQTESLKKIMKSLLTPEEIAAVTARAQSFESNLGETTKASNIIDQITAMAETNHMKMIQIYPDSPVLVKNDEGKELEVGGKKLNILPVSFRVETDYENLGNFLKSLSDNSKWTYVVEALLLQKPDEASESLQCDMTISYITR